jgi:hypothetical protein
MGRKLRVDFSNDPGSLDEARDDSGVRLLPTLLTLSDLLIDAHSPEPTPLTTRRPTAPTHQRRRVPLLCLPSRRARTSPRA